MNAVSTNAARRKLHIGHFAFMRSVVQGLDTRDSWNRYLRVEGEHTDAGKVNRTIAWIRDEFAAAAKRNDRPGTARLVRIDVRNIADLRPALPTVEEYAAAHGLEDFSAVEQLEQYKAHYATVVARPSRRSRLITRQLEALNWLERLAVQPPQPDDSIASWLHPDLSRRLEQAGIATLRDLVDRINGKGMRWWTGIRAIGSGKAARLVEWLIAQEESVGLSIGTHIASKRSTWSVEQREAIRPATTGIVPIQKLVVPDSLDGANGLYRAPRHLCDIPAHNDVQAIYAWIDAKRQLAAQTPASVISPAENALRGYGSSRTPAYSLSHTQRAYLKEAERFLLWTLIEQRKALSSIASADCEAYCKFLENPHPRARWCGPRSREKWGPLWRPFEGPLSPRAQRQAITILKNLGNFLAHRGYLLASPWAGVQLPGPSPCKTSPQFTDEEWETVIRHLDRLPWTSANERLKFVLPLLHATGMRLSEAVGATIDDLQWAGKGSYSDSKVCFENWLLNVVDAAGEQQQLPIPHHVIARLTTYLASRGLDAELTHPEYCGVYLIGKAVDVVHRAHWSPQHMLEVNPREGVAAGTLSRQIRSFFSDCAAALAATDPVSAKRLSGATSNWFKRPPSFTTKAFASDRADKPV